MEDRTLGEIAYRVSQGGCPMIEWKNIGWRAKEYWNGIAHAIAYEAVRHNRDDREKQVDDLAIFVRRLVRLARKLDGDCVLTNNALDYLREHDLKGDWLRETQALENARWNESPLGTVHRYPDLCLDEMRYRWLRENCHHENLQKLMNGCPYGS